MVENITTSKLYPYLALGTGILIIGFSPILIRVAEAPGSISAFYRMALASIFIVLPFLHQTNKKSQKLPWQGVSMAIWGGIFFGLDLSLWSTGIMLSGPTTPTLMANTAPLWVGLGAFFFFRERQSKSFWLGLILAMLGAVVVLGQDLLKATNFSVGTLLGLFAAFFYAAFYLASQQGRANLGTLAYFSITTFSASVLLLIVNLLFGQALSGYNQNTYLAFLGLGIGVQIFGWLIITYAQGHLPASIVSPTLLGQPIVTAILAAFLLHEVLTRWQIGGGLIVLGGVYLVHRSSTKVSHKNQKT